jgi:hypothetical protein
MVNKTNRLEIRIMEHSDIEEARLLHNDDSVLALLSDPFHVSEISQQKWFESISNSRQSRRYVARLISDGTFIGVFRFDQIDQTNRSVMIGADIVSTHRRSGFATEIFNYFFRYRLIRLISYSMKMEYIKKNVLFYNWCGFQERKLWNEFYDTYAKELEQYDGFICCYPPIFAMLYQRFNKPIIIDIPIRYEYPWWCYCYSNEKRS